MITKHQLASLFSFFCLLFLSASYFGSTAQTADYTISLSTNSVDAQAEGIGPGDVVCLEAGTRNHRLLLRNFNGTAQNPIIIKNCNGQAIINEQDGNGYGIAVNASNHFRLTGSGDDEFEYGIVVNNNGATMGVTVGGLSGEGIEVDHIKVTGAGFAAFMVKTDPGCDPATWRENHIMRDVRVHDNYVQYTLDGEGFYIGFTFSDGYEVTCDGVTQTVYGHLIENLEVYNNRTEDTGSEGIQVSSSPNAVIRDNTVYKAGQRPFADYQANGIQVSGTGVSIYNNRVDTIGANGLIIFGTGHKIFNNLVLNTVNDGVFADDRKTGEGMLFANNTIVNSGEDGFSLYYDETTPSIVKNNLIINPTGQFFHKLNNNVTVDESNNLFYDTVAEAQFVDAASGNYRPQESSPVVNAGADLSALGVTFDISNASRPQGTAYDVGAYEWGEGTDVLVGDPARQYPAHNTTLEPQPLTSTSWSRFRFAHKTGIEWYAIWIGPADYSRSDLYDWFDASKICEGATCTLPNDLWLLDGDYEWWMTYWSPSLAQPESYWNRTTFTVDYGAPGTIQRTPPASSNPSALTSTYDPKVLWYRAWIGPADYSDTLLFDWFDARDVCSKGVCTFDTSDITFDPGEYEWWMEAWGPGGYRIFDVDTPLTFSIES